MGAESTTTTCLLHRLYGRDLLCYCPVRNSQDCFARVQSFATHVWDFSLYELYIPCLRLTAVLPACIDTSEDIPPTGTAAVAADRQLGPSLLGILQRQNGSYQHGTSIRQLFMRFTHQRYGIPIAAPCLRRPPLHACLAADCGQCHRLCSTACYAAVSCKYKQELKESEWRCMAACSVQLPSSHHFFF